jgi:RNA ligase
MIHPAKLMDFDQLEQGLFDAVQAGHVYRRTSGDLSLYVYTKECVYERAWNEYSLLARGLILDHVKKEVVALPFPKFFNISEANVTIPDLPFETFEKVDGSLIIIFFHNGKWQCATKGSFDSDQAQWAQTLLDNMVIGKACLVPGWTYLCEAIYPENKIVISYQESGLVLLGGYTDKGEELDYNNLNIISSLSGWMLAPRYSYNSISELLALAKELPASREGFVLRFNNGYRIKIKGDEYCRIHSLVSRLTPLTVWELLNAGDDTEAMRKELPEEFWADFDQILRILQSQVSKFLNKVYIAVLECKDMSNKELGLCDTVDPEVKSFIFAYRKNNDLLGTQRGREAIYKKFRPTGNVLEGYVPSYGVKVLQEVDA